MAPSRRSLSFMVEEGPKGGMVSICCPQDGERRVPPGVPESGAHPTSESPSSSWHRINTGPDDGCAPPLASRHPTETHRGFELPRSKRDQNFSTTFPSTFPL